MKRLSLLLVFSLLSTQTFAQTRRVARRMNGNSNAPSRALENRPDASQILPIRRVILYSNGVAYIERRGTVAGHAEIALAFKQSQIDDVLKSMVVLDLGGRIGAVSYNSSAPPSARLGEIPFSIASGTAENGGLAGVLKQLQGARVAVTTQNRTLTGAILTVEDHRSQIDANKPPFITHTLVISSEGGELTSFDLQDVRGVKLLDEGARRDVSQFADAVASARRRDAKTIVVTSDGTGAREMIVSYTVAAPIWKTSYRVVMDEKTGKPFFQGWAIVDNVSEEDWSNVQLSLVSGTPISFIQPLQQPLYRYRPVVPIREDLQLNPQTYEPSESNGYGAEYGAGRGGSMGGNNSKDELAVISGAKKAANKTLNVMPKNAPQNQIQNLAQISPGIANESVTVVPANEEPVGIGIAMTGGASGVEAAANGAEVGDLFEYRIEHPVTVKRDRSALIPILQTYLGGERVSVFNETTRRDRPMSGIFLENTSPLTLEDGALTVIDGNSYAGEALLQRLKPREKRFVTFALDLGTLVTVRQITRREPVFLLKAVNGVFQMHYYQTEQKIYKITNQTDRARTVFVEHPFREDWNLTDDTPKPADKTARFYRFRVELQPREAREIPVTERRALMDSYALSDITPQQIELFFHQRYIDDATRLALERITAIKDKIASVDAQIQTFDTEREQIAEDQKRLRENIEALNKTAEARTLIARYVAKVNDQETRLETINTETRKLTDERARLQNELGDAIRSFALERKQ
jgi:archaellum component FlaC